MDSAGCPLSLLSGGMGTNLPDACDGGDLVGYPSPFELIVELRGTFLKMSTSTTKSFEMGTCTKSLL